MHLRHLQLARMLAPEDGGAGGSGATPPATPPAPAAAQTFSHEYVRELREENKGWRLKASEMEKNATEARALADKAVADAKAASEKASKDADERVTTHTSATNARLVRAEIRAGATAAGLGHPDFLKLIDTSAVKVGEDGEVQVPEGFWAEAKSRLPHLFAATGADKGTTSHPSAPPKPAPTAQRSAKDMSKDEWRAEMKRLGVKI